MTVDKALDAALEELPPLHDPDEDGPLPVNSYAAGYEAGLREARDAFPRMFAAALREVAASPTPEMVDAGLAEIKPDGLPADRSDAAACWRAMASKLAEQVEGRPHE